MKYITEAQLRDLYKESPFTSYECSFDTRLTPNARQFLIDFRIEIVDSEHEKTRKKLKKDSNCNPNQNNTILDQESRIKLLVRKLAVELKSFEPIISCELFNLSKDLEKFNLKELKILDNAQDKAEEIFMNLEISSPYLELFIVIDDFATEIRNIRTSEDEKEIVDCLVEYTYSLYVNNVKGGKDN